MSPESLVSPGPLASSEPSQDARTGRAVEVMCVGEALAVVYALDDLTGPAPRLAIHTGGAERNVALHLASQGVAAGWTSRVGGDPFGRRILHDLESGGVDTGTVVVDDDHPTGLYVKSETPDGGTRMHYYRSGSAASHLSPDDVVGMALDGVQWVHVSGITPALSASASAMVDELFARCAHAGTAISFDVNYRPRLWPRSRAASRLRELAQRADLVFVGRDEAADLWGTRSPEDVFALLPDPARVVVKDGAVGAYESDRSTSGRTTFVETPPVEVVEAIGAGDAFAGGYLAGLIRGETAGSRLLRGHRCAAWTIGSWDDVRPGHRHDPFDTEGQPRRTETA